MENTSLVALSQQLVLRNKLDVIANNVANINTAGFKRQSLELDEYEMPVARANTFPTLDQTISFVEDWTTTTDFEPGTLETTGSPFDVAIQGDGFFVVQSPAGERYTRAGNFQLDAGGRLVTPNGHPVMVDGGEIVFGPDETDVVIGPDGTISTNIGSRGRLQIVSFEDNRLLEQAGDTLFSGENPLPAEAVRVQQGSVELSNVQSVVEMTRMIEVTRAYTQISSMIAKQDDLRLKAISQLGDVRA